MKLNYFKGKKGENIAAEHLEKQGMAIIEKNWRFSRLGEIDIIAKDGDALVFIEVKARSSLNYGHPLEAISPDKIATIHKLAEIYLNKNTYTDYKNIRFDIIGILTNKNIEIQHIKGIC